MNKFNQDYYFIFPAIDGRLPYMTGDEDTMSKPYDYQELPLGTKPLIFYNGGLDWQKANRIKPMDQPPDILFNVPNILVKDYIRDKLIKLDIPNLAIQASIYIDHNEKWHEDYWYLTFTEVFDCWDRSKSTYNHDPVDELGPPRFGIYSYSLNDEILNNTPLKSRLIFKMGGTLDEYIVVHKSIAGLFKASGAVLVPISDFGVIYP